MRQTPSSLLRVTGRTGLSSAAAKGSRPLAGSSVLWLRRRAASCQWHFSAWASAGLGSETLRSSRHINRTSLQSRWPSSASAIGWFITRQKIACAEDEACARPLPNKLVKITLIIATIIVIAAWSFDYVAPYLLS
jgi:hypothetical protein